MFKIRQLIYQIVHAKENESIVTAIAKIEAKKKPKLKQKKHINCWNKKIHIINNHE